MVWFCSVIKLHVLELPKTSCADPRFGVALVLKREFLACCSSNHVPFQPFPARPVACRPSTIVQFASHVSSSSKSSVPRYTLCLFSDSSSHSLEVEDDVSVQSQCALHSLRFLLFARTNQTVDPSTGPCLGFKVTREYKLHTQGN